jgi:hypothetical protein
MAGYHRGQILQNQFSRGLRMLLSESNQVMALVASNVNQQDVVVGKRGRHEAVQRIHIKPGRPTLAPTRHVGVEEDLLVSALSKPLELTLPDSPAHWRLRVILRSCIVVLAKVFR